MSELRRALCCECGNLRTFRKGYTLPNWIGEGHHHNLAWHYKSHREAVERLRAGNTRNKRSRDYWVRHADPFERYTGTLKCQPCGDFTKHAVVRPAEVPDHAEAWDHGWDTVYVTGRGFVWQRREEADR